MSAKHQNLYTLSPLMSVLFSKHGVVQESHSHLGNVIQLPLTCSSVSWSWSHCLVCWKPSWEGWQPETCRIMGLIRFSGLCTIWLVWRESHSKHLNSTWDQITPSTLQLNHKYFSTVNKPLGCLICGYWIKLQLPPAMRPVVCHTSMHVCSNVQ